MEENFKTLTTKRNNVRVLEYNEKWKDGLMYPLLLAENGRMFRPDCKECDKTSKDKIISGCELMCIEKVCSQEASNVQVGYW